MARRFEVEDQLPPPSEFRRSVTVIGGLDIEKDPLKWFAPRWSFAPRLWRQLDSVLSRGAIVRIVALSFLIGGAIVGGLKLTIPNFVMPQIWKLLLIFPGFICFLLFYVFALTVIPQRIVIHRDKIIIEHSQKRVIDTSSVSKIWLYVHPSNRLRIKVRFDTGGKPRTRTIGIAPHVNLDRLCNLLPCPVTVRDACDRNPNTQTTHRTKP